MTKKIIGNKVTRCLNGKIRIDIECYPDSFQTTLTIAPGLCKGNVLKEQNEKVAFEIIALCDISEECIIKGTFSYPTDNEGDFDPKIIELLLNKSVRIRGWVRVFPKFYMPLVMLKLAQSNQATKDKDNLEDVRINTDRNRPSPSKYVQYTGVGSPSRHYRG